MSNGLTLMVQVELDFGINAELKTHVALNKKLGVTKENKERTLGIMIEQQFTIQQLLEEQALSFNDLLLLIKNVKKK